MTRDVVVPPRVSAPGTAPVVAARLPGARRGLLPALLLLFFGTGACGLVYQQLWVRLLSLVFGVTIYAVATVLASFFAGLALGSFVDDGRARRRRTHLCRHDGRLAGLRRLAHGRAIRVVVRRVAHPGDAHGRELADRRAFRAGAVGTAGGARQPAVRDQYRRRDRRHAP